MDQAIFISMIMVIGAFLCLIFSLIFFIIELRFFKGTLEVSDEHNEKNIDALYMCIAQISELIGLFDDIKDVMQKNVPKSRAKHKRTKNS
ncbi:MAG: hypothetical protein Q4E88_02685 [Coriobacteriia bacterium]|nr:hypothetical protein [Coriobacteriia bacterium]